MKIFLLCCRGSNALLETDEYHFFMQFAGHTSMQAPQSVHFLASTRGPLSLSFRASFSQVLTHAMHFMQSSRLIFTAILSHHYYYYYYFLDIYIFLSFCLVLYNIICFNPQQS